MMNKLRLSSSIILIALFMSFLPQPALATDAPLPTIRVAINDDQSVINDRILNEALTRSGYQMVAQVTGMRTAVSDVNYGDAAILPLQTDGWDRDYPNLVKVPVVVEHVEFSTYTRSDEPHAFLQWGDMAGLRLGYRLQNVFVANNASRADASALVEVNSIEDLWASLLNGDTDVVVLPRMAHYEHRFPKGIRRAGVIERLPCFTYVNNKYDYLVPLLEKAYLEMIADGTMHLIRNSINTLGNKQNILHLYSYSEQLEWERSQIDFIRKALEPDAEIAYRSIGLNANELHSQASFNYIISNMIRTDHIAHYPDLVIASGNEALEFVMDNYYLLFPQTPVTFFGVHGLDDATLYGLEDYVTGVVENVSFYETALEMLRIYPKTQRIFILNDHHISRSIAIRGEIQESIDAHRLPVEIVFSESKPFAEILNDIRSFGPDTLVVIGSYISDSSGSFFPETDVQKLVTAASANPVFCLTASYIGHGPVGGFLSGTDEYKNVVSSMISDLLNGVSPGSIQIVYNSEFLNQWQFDHEAARRFNIDTRSLPAGHVVINRTLAVWESNPQEFTMMIAIAVLLLLIICGLVVFSRILRKKRAEAETASIAKSAFLSNMSHEIRTPMNAITGMAELSLREDIPPTIREYVLGIKQAGNNLLEIINDILDFSKIESGNMDLFIDDYTLSSLINDVIHNIKARAHESRLRFVVNIDNNIPNTLEGDAKRIRQIILNLMSNAVKYTEKGFVSLVVNGRMTAEDSYMLNIEVSDSGKGIAPNNIDMLFDKFARFDNETNKNVEGTGLGLAITKSIIDAMGGTIDVSSTLGVGSTFTVKLPQRIKDHKKLAVVNDLEKMNVLVFERREVSKNSIIQTMEGLGVRYTLVETASDFSEELATNNYTCVFVAAALFDRVKHIREEVRTTAKFVLVAEFGEVVEERNISILMTPIFSLPVADFLNNVSNFTADDEPNRESGNWVAPEARILSVDDINTNLSVLEGLLKPYKVLVVSCKSGMEALEAVKAAPYDLVFMDHMMPGMDGMETTQRIRALGSDYPHMEKMPIVALSANALLGMKEKFLQNGFNDFLSKPIDIIKLDSILAKWLPKEKQKDLACNAVSVAPVVEQHKRTDKAASETEGVNIKRGMAISGGTTAACIPDADRFKAELACMSEALSTVDRGGINKALANLQETVPDEECAATVKAIANKIIMAEYDEAEQLIKACRHNQE